VTAISLIAMGNVGIGTTTPAGMLVVLSSNPCPVGTDNGDGTCTATFYPDANPETSSVDGWVGQDSNSATWAAIRDGAGNQVADSATNNFIWIRSGGTPSTWNNISRLIFLFNASSLPDNTTIASAVLSLYGSAKVDSLNISPAVNIYSSNPASNVALAASDYTLLGTTAFSTAITYANWSISGYNNFTLNSSGIAAISKTGVSKFGARESNYDVPNVTPAYTYYVSSSFTMYMAEQGSGYQPKLVVTYTASSAPSLFVSKTTGNVGIGTAGPESSVQISGGGLCVGSDANCNIDNNTEGYVYAGQTAMTVYDVAETYPTKDSTLDAAEIVTLDPDNAVFVKRSSSAYDSKVLGVISSEPAVLLGGFKTEKTQFKNEIQVPVTLSGRVPVNVSAENGPIAIGDLLTSSLTPGVAMKATSAGRVIGLALEGYNSNTTSTSQIMVFVNPHWWGGALDPAGLLSFGTSTASSTTSSLFSGLLESVWDAITGLPKLIVNGILEVKNDVVSHGAFKSIVKVAKTVVEGRTIMFDNAASLAENSQLEVAGEDADSLSFVTYSIVSPRKEILVSGSGKLLTQATSSSSVEAKIAFHPYFSAIISTSTPIRVVLTPSSYINGGLYVAEKSIYGFTVKEINSQDEGAEFDWIVTARLTDPELAQTVLGDMNNLATQENIGSTTSTSPVYQNGANRPCSTEVGVCQIGVQIYYDGVWGTCMGAVFPTDELCDGVDNDCDATIDEGGVCSTIEPEPEATSTEPIAESEPKPEPVITTSTEPLVETSTTTAITATSTEQ